MRKLMVNIVCGVIPSRPLRKKLRAYLLNYAQEAMFLKFADSTVPPPPSTIPEKRYSSFTLDGRIPVRYRYYDSRIAGGKRIISRIDYANAFKAFEKGIFKYYGNGFKYFLEAFDSYPIAGKHVLIFGLASCNLDALSVWKGAKKVTVIDYNKPVCENDNVMVMTHEEAEKMQVKADIVISYSSFEHDGLGRYGDPIDPDGDLKAMDFVFNHLADNGMVFIGVPTGMDGLVWNTHRVYGKIRMPMLLRKFHLLDVFGGWELGRGQAFEQAFDEDHFFQPLMVLSKQPTMTVPMREKKPGDQMLFNEISRALAL